jgi:hypothetical protein
MKLKGKVLIGFGEYKVGGFILGPSNLMKELQAEGFIELDSNEPIEDVEKSKRGRKPKD